MPTTGPTSALTGGPIKLSGSPTRDSPETPIRARYCGIGAPVHTCSMKVLTVQTVLARDALQALGLKGAASLFHYDPERLGVVVDVGWGTKGGRELSIVRPVRACTHCDVRRLSPSHRSTSTRSSPPAPQPSTVSVGAPRLHRRCFDGCRRHLWGATALVSSSRSNSEPPRRFVRQSPARCAPPLTVAGAVVGRAAHASSRCCSGDS